MLPRPILDSRSDTPLYRQLSDCIKNSIQSRDLNDGQRLPATRELAGLLGLNRTTVSAAYKLLETEGFLRGHVGRGSFVCANPQVDWVGMLPGDDARPTSPPSQSEISFSSSRPSELLFPLEDFRAACREVIDSDEAQAILQLGSPVGYPPLRRYLLDLSLAEGCARPSDDILITSGCQQSFDLIQRILVANGETVLLEDPVYPGLRSVFARAGARLTGIPVTPDGLSLEHLERALVKERPRLVVVTSSFQNPTGATLPLEQRRALSQLVRKHGAVLVENDVYGALAYSGDPLPTVKQLDPAGDTILLRSFSKLAFPGLRVGWVVAPRTLIAKLADTKQLSDLHTDQLSQAVLLRFAESGRLAEHRSHVLANGLERLRAAIHACESYLPAGARFTRPQGGMSLWVRLPEPLDADDLLQRAERRGVTYLPGKYFEVSRHEAGALRLSFAQLTPQKIREGIAILGQVFGSELKRARLDPAPAMV